MKESKSTLNWICNALQFITHRTKFYETFLPCLFAEDEDAAMDNVDKDIWESPFGFGLTVLYVHVVFDSVLTFSKHFIYIYGLDNVACFHCIKMFYTLQMGGSQWLPRFFYSLSLSLLSSFHWISEFDLCVSKRDCIRNEFIMMVYDVICVDVDKISEELFPMFLIPISANIQLNCNACKTNLQLQRQNTTHQIQLSKNDFSSGPNKEFPSFQLIDKHQNLQLNNYLWFAAFPPFSRVSTQSTVCLLRAARKTINSNWNQLKWSTN